MSNSGTTFLALLTGAAIGAGLGLLYAPDSGDETRRRLSEKAKRAKIDFEVRLEETLSSASYKADEILASLETKLDELRKQNAKFQREHPKGGAQPNTGQTGGATDSAVV